ncbi:MAG TPA: vWA domain-containing protein [Vicinamibacterales bacterium]|nr:vWA domain-containing protein [Vicinamibacterales bacterium]
MIGRVLAGGLLVLSAALSGCQREEEPAARQERTDRRIDADLAPPGAVETREGLAAAIVIDVSGSMGDGVAGLDGRKEPKIEIARRAARDLVEQFARYAEEHADEPVLLGLYEFSRRRGDPDCRPVIPIGPPDRARAASAIDRLQPDGGTPIGQAMITAKRELDGTGLTRRHLLLVTDGENTDGYPPDRVAAAIGRRPDAERPSIYFVAFDVDARRFARVRDAGALVLPAANARELNDTLDSLLRGRILVEK